MKIGLLRCREEPPKLLQGNKFQERTFQIKEHKLLLLKDKKVRSRRERGLSLNQSALRRVPYTASPDWSVSLFRASSQRRSGL